MADLRRADLWFGLALFLFGAAATFESWRMPRLENLGIDPLSAPGLTPGLLALVLACLGLTLVARSLLAAPAPADDAPQGGWRRLAITLGLCLIYSVGLVGRVPFFLATMLFVTTFVATFSHEGRPVWRTLLTAIVLGGGVALAVTLLFEKIFLVRLP